MNQNNQPTELRSAKELDRLFEEYLPKLIAVAANRIGDRFQGKFDGEDIAGTVCRSVFRRWKDGKFTFDDDAEFWRLLVTIAKRKISNLVRHFNTEKCDINLEVSEVANAIVASPEPGPQDAVAIKESISKLARRLDDLENQIFKLRMEGREFQEIADQLGVSERTVRRKIIVIRERLVGLFDVSPAPDSSAD